MPHDAEDSCKCLGVKPSCRQQNRNAVIRNCMCNFKLLNILTYSDLNITASRENYVFMVLMLYQGLATIKRQEKI